MQPKERKRHGKQVLRGKNSEFIVTETEPKCLGKPCKSWS